MKTLKAKSAAMNESEQRRRLEARVQVLDGDSARHQRTVVELEERIRLNFNKHAKDRADLKQARLDLAEFESIKAQHLTLKAHIETGTEIEALKFEYERKLESMAQELRNGQALAERGHIEYKRKREELDSALEYERLLLDAYRALRCEFMEEIGQKPRTRRPRREDE